MDNALDLFLKRNNETQKMMNLAFAGNSTMQKFAEMQSNWKEKFNIMDIFDSRKRIDLIINNDWSKSFQNDSLKNEYSAVNYTTIPRQSAPLIPRQSAPLKCII